MLKYFIPQSLKVISIIIVFSISCLSVEAAGSSAGNRSAYETVRIIDMPNAGLISKNNFSVYTNFFQNGGMLAKFSFSPFSNFNFGLSMSGTEIIGKEDIQWQNLPGIQIKARIFDERLTTPAVTAGLETQGTGAYYNAAKHFAVYSPGLYLALSKNFGWRFGEVAVHGGINYSFEPNASDKSVNFFAGTEISFTEYTSLCFEYNACKEKYFGLSNKNADLLNASLRANIFGLTFEFIVRDILDNHKSLSGTRSVGIEYITRF